MPKSEVPAYDVPALRKAIQVLEVLAGSEEALGVSEVARLADIPKNMAFRLLVTLDDLGWIHQTDPKPRYQLTLKPFRLFAQLVSRNGLTEACQAPLKWLHQQCHETVYVGVLHENKALNVQVIDGTGTIRVAAEVGSAFDLHCTAHGKVLLAHALEKFQDEYLSTPLTAYTDRTITSGKDMKAELEQVKSRGYALNDEEYGRGLVGVASPVFDAQGKIRAAIGVFTATMNLSIGDIEDRIVPLVKEAAKQASLNSAAQE